jgi:hypothetical protein
MKPTQRNLKRNFFAWIIAAALGGASTTLLADQIVVEYFDEAGEKMVLVVDGDSSQEDLALAAAIISNPMEYGYGSGESVVPVVVEDGTGLTAMEIMTLIAGETSNLAAYDAVVAAVNEAVQTNKKITSSLVVAPQMQMQATTQDSRQLPSTPIAGTSDPASTTGSAPSGGGGGSGDGCPVVSCN